LLPTPGLDGDLLRLGSLRLRQGDPHQTILEGGLGFAGIDLEGERRRPLELA
jgi:hypothetical protein